MKGRAQIADQYSANAFNDPARHAMIVTRIVMGYLVVDHKGVSLTHPDGPDQMEAVVPYEIREGKIRTATLIRE